MDNKSFDHIIKAKLENLTSDATPRWDLFKEKKSVHDAIRVDTAFDNSIRRTVSEYEAPYNSNHWNLLKARLERIYGLRKALYSVKIYELLAVLVLFYSVGNNYDYIFGTDTSIEITSQPIALVAEQDIASETIHSAYTPTEISDATIISSSKTTNTKVASNNGSARIENTVNPLLASEVNGNNIIENNRFNNAQNNVAVFDNPSIGGIENTEDISEVTEQDAILTLESIAAITSKVETNSLEEISLFKDNFGIKPLNKITTDSKWLQVAASFDNNQITTPFNETYNLGPQSSEMFGYSLSGLFSVEKGNLEYETGLTYSVYNKPMAFKRPWDNNIGDVFIYSLTNVNYDILGTPLRVKYHFATTPDWSLYITGGISPEFIVNTGYDERNEKLNFNAPAPVGVDLKPELTESPFRTESNFHQGLFEQGSFRDNFMLRAQFGAGMQRNITPTLSAFIAGDYYSSIINTTYGPTNDKINKFSITFGVKERF